MTNINTNSDLCVTAFSSPKTKYAVAVAAGMLGVMLSVSSASAFQCVRGAYRAGCISSRGLMKTSMLMAKAVATPTKRGSVMARPAGTSTGVMKSANQARPGKAGIRTWPMT